MLVLYAESFAPWCERARWALDHHYIGYSVVEHTPLIGEPRLRLKSRRWFSRVSVPLLVGDRWCIMDSTEIARFADRTGEGRRLFPPAHEQEIAHWCQRAELLMSAGRMRILGAGRDAVHGMREVGPDVPAPLAPARDFALLMTLRYLRRKYGSAGSVGDHRNNALGVIGDLQEKISPRSNYLVGNQFTFADIAMACALQFILPVANAHMEIGDGTRALWTWDELQDPSADCLGWRNSIYGLHRKPGPPKHSISPARG